MDINYNNLPQIEGIRDFIVDRIHEKVFPYMERQGLFQDDDNETLNRVREFMDRAEHLPGLYLNSGENGSEKCREEIDALYDELKALLELCQTENQQAKKL
ncbi:MAG: hypothetical protein LUD82_08200 [Clostridiales bacterium]|nr:hypothetical protein [Clostridiales bacterium]MCD8127409.1 hypothetical protein [Clostridiales bacterium]